MDINQPQLSFEITHRDEEMIQVDVMASNGRYTGTTSFYSDANGKELFEFVKKLQGFPKEVGQVEEQEFGYTKNEILHLKESNLGFKTAMWYVGLKFFCFDKTWHTAVSIVLLEENWTEREEARGQASFELKFDPAQLDEFVQELIVLAESKEGKATLIGRLA